MWFNSFFRPKQSSKRAPGGRIDSPAYPRRSFLPRLEVLEDRTVPSQIVAISVPDPLSTFSHNTNWQHATTDSEVEPWVSVNPTNPNNIVAIWIAHDFSGNVASVSFDEGTTWQNVAIPGIPQPSSSAQTSGADPWLAFASN